MKIALWTVMGLGALTLVACGHDNSQTASTGMSGGSGTGSSAPTSSAPTDFEHFVTDQVASQPAYGTTPVPITSLTTDLELNNASAFASVSKGSGDALPAGTAQASVACAQAGTTACNPAVSADLNSTLN